MTKQPEALLIADVLEDGTELNDRAASELRRLYQMNQELLEALKEAADAFEIASNGGGVNFYQYAKEIQAAIAKATGEQE